MKATNNIWNKAAERIAAAVSWMQNIFVRCMDRCTAGMSLRTIRVVLFFFCAGTGGYSMWLIGKAIFFSDRKAVVLKVDRLRVPKHIHQEESLQTPAVIHEELFQSIQQFKKRMDSTGRTISPGLKDSIEQIEKIYHQQK